MDEVKIQYLKADYTLFPSPFYDSDEDDASRLHINRKSIEFTNTGGIDSFGDYDMSVTPHVADSGLSTCSCDTTPAQPGACGWAIQGNYIPRRSVGVDTGVPAVNQWLKDYQADIKQSYRRTE